MPSPLPLSSSLLQSTGTTFVWVRTDLISHGLQNNKVPASWKPRKRSRALPDDDWGWCRCTLTNAQIQALSNLNKGSVGIGNSNNSLRSVQLRPTNKTPWNTSQNTKENDAKRVTITVIDTIWAPPAWNGQQVTVKLDSALYNQLVCPANTWWTQILLREGSDGEDAVIAPPDDLTHLEQLHEPAVVYCLWERYQHDVIYTYTGKILLALNPFRPLPLYGDEYMNLYSQPSALSMERPPPHIYATAKDAYRSLLQNTKNQSILVSGESGAGKTVTTKIILRYLATLSQQQTDEQFHTTSIEAQVLQSNPILESFGNARTIRNDNSSRFGKFMQVQFNSRGALVSAQIETYLLEKVRLLTQAPGERNYHIFYELLAGLPQRDRQTWFIAHSTAQDFVLTAGSAQLGRRDNVDDRETYHELRHALDIVGFDTAEQHNLFTVLCALLRISNITFTESGKDDSSALDRSNPSLQAAVKLLGVDVDQLEAALTLVAIEAAGDRLHKHLSVQKAHKALEAFIKVTYGALFKCLVQRINESIAGSTRLSSSSHSIGVLDIFGFESFEENSLEQLCINYCNEALQQQFNRFVFTLEQEEYKREGIEWSFISFPDNQDVLDLIERKRDGILSILDEQCRLPRCTDKSFALSIYDKCQSHPRFEATKAQQAVLSFGVQHYAGVVEYCASSFLEKNKDELPKEATELLKTSALDFYVHLGSLLCETPRSSSVPTRRPATNKRQFSRSFSSLIHESVGLQFTSQLRTLRTRIESTEPHYVRCLKPNDDLTPHNFDAVVMADQLRCAGVLEAIRVSRVGFPHRYTHDQFIHRYCLLTRALLLKQKRSSAKDKCQFMVSTLTLKVAKLLEGQENTCSSPKHTAASSSVYLGMQLGKTKVFLRRQAFDALEHLHARCLDEAAVKMQSFVRMSNALMRYEISMYAVVLLQNFFRKVGSYRHYRALQKLNSSQVLQRAWRCYVARKIYHSALFVACWGQSIYRGTVARQYCAYLFLDWKVSLIQKLWKRFLNRRILMKVRRSIVALQSQFRRKQATKALYQLRVEAKDLGRVAAERDRFRQESLALRKQLDGVMKISPAKPKYTTPPKVPKTEEVASLKKEVKKLQAELEQVRKDISPSNANRGEVASLQSEMAQKEAELRQLRVELSTLRSHVSSHNGSLSGMSFTIESPSAGLTPRLLDTSLIKPSSPIRSDLSLLDQGLAHKEESSVITPRNTDFSSRTLFPEPGDIGSKSTDDVEHLHSAIKVGSRGLFDQIIGNSTEPCILVNQGDNYGRTALHVAVVAQDLDAVAGLLAKGAAVNTQDIEGETPLHLSEDAKTTRLLLEKGNANANIPNIDGICALHLAVQRRDTETVRVLLRNNASVNNADNIRWFTPLHLIALPASQQPDSTANENSRLRIARQLLELEGPNSPDLDYQDREGNSPLHYAVQLDTSDACLLVKLFMEKGANPNICNDRSQSPLHLLCHNDFLRAFDGFQDALHCMLYHGANPNLQSMTGCTPLHLSLYHQDIKSASQLISRGAELHLLWKKPKRWAAFWNDMGSPDVLALDMVEDKNSLQRLISSISNPHAWAPTRSWCMQCHHSLGKSKMRALHCRHCSRLICDICATSCLPSEYFPKNFNITDAAWVCYVCEKILVSRKDEIGSSSRTLPTSSYGDDDELYAC